MHKCTQQWLGVLLGLCGAIAASAQDIGINWHPLDGTAYQSEALPEVHVTCDQLDWMLEQENWYSNVEHPAVFVYVSPLGTDTIENIGFACVETPRAPPPRSRTKSPSTPSTPIKRGKD